ncbi:hypothetical protein [Carnobacterium sp. TMP28]|uniref:hypothetical protein n=1 Tax=Carnobacterium sp. TMP28 TaxID=3397060 RepID=UPI0039DF9707
MKTPEWGNSFDSLVYFEAMKSVYYSTLDVSDGTDQFRHPTTSLVQTKPKTAEWRTRGRELVI